MEQNNNAENKKDEVDCRTGCSNRFKALGTFIWNSETREVLGRTGISWLKIVSFYIIFYGVLAAFFAICMVVFLKTLDSTQPTQQMMYSMLKNNPGVGFVPQAQPTTTDIYFNSADEQTWSGSSMNYTGLLSDELAKYTNDANSKLKNCSSGNGATIDQACQFYISSLGNQCTAENNFGYDIGKPCVLLKINKVFKWDPIGTDDTIDQSQLKCMDNNIPPQDTSNICQLSQVPSSVRTEVTKGFISVSCEGENDGDVDNINKVTFYPSNGFPAYYFPYYNQPSSYLPPLVMAQFDVVSGRAIMISCKIWTKSNHHDRNDLEGLIHFELQVDFPHANTTTTTTTASTTTDNPSSSQRLTTTISASPTTKQ